MCCLLLPCLAPVISKTAPNLTVFRIDTTASNYEELALVNVKKPELALVNVKKTSENFRMITI